MANSFTIEIIDDDRDPTMITLSVNPTTLGEADGETSFLVTATLNGSGISTATVVTLTLGGTAAAPGDYGVTTALASVTIPAGSTSGSGSLTLTPVDDGLVEGNETIVVNGTTAGFTVSSASITLNDNDGAPRQPAPKIVNLAPYVEAPATPYRTGDVIWVGVDFDSEIAVYFDPDLATYKYPILTLQIGPNDQNDQGDRKNKRTKRGGNPRNTQNDRLAGCTSESEETYDAGTGETVYRMWCGYTVRANDFDSDGFSVSRQRPQRAVWACSSSTRSTPEWRPT